MRATADDGHVEIHGSGMEGIQGYRISTDRTLHINAELFVNGESKGVTEFSGPYDEGDEFVEIMGADFAAGDTVKVVAHMDPAKTEFIQDDVIAEVTAE